mmetsp:Transcript_12303/g.26547  ORF Transcript_12303/g.26547 Transcript_12303/m.26547 type:complete len:585 (-) Transcript_12303:429-2183(-)
MSRLTLTGSQLHSARTFHNRRDVGLKFNSVQKSCYTFLYGRTYFGSHVKSSSNSAPITGQDGGATSQAQKQAKGVASPLSVLRDLFPPAEALQLLRATVTLLRQNFWPIIAIYAFKDTLAFVLHRVSHRCTNLVAETALGMPISQFANPWWLFLETSFLEHNIGYQACIVAFFLICLPLNILLSTYAVAATMAICKRSDSTDSAGTSRPVTDGAVQGSSEAHLGAAGSASAPAATSTAQASSGSSSTDSTDSSSSTATASSRAASAEVSPDAAGLAQLASSSGAPQNGLQAGQKTGTSSTGTSTSKQAEPAEWLNGSGNASSSSSSASSTSSSNGAGPAGTDTTAHASTSGTSPSVVSTGSGSTAPAAGAAAEPAKPPSPGIMARMKAGVQRAWSTVPQVNAMLRRIWWVDMLFNLQALPLQALSMLVITIPWTMPRLISIQLSLPVAVDTGLEGKSALQRSGELMKGWEAAYGWPFIAIILGIRLVDVICNAVLTAIPSRWWQDVIEVPIGLTLLFGFAKLIVIRLQDLMPLAAYLAARDSEAKGTKGSGAAAGRGSTAAAGSDAGPTPAAVVESITSPTPTL